jgi:hypothetical protein
VEGALEEKIFPGGWNSQIKTNYTEYYPDHVQSVKRQASSVKRQEMIHSGWSSRREAVNTQHHHGLVEDNMEEKEMIPGEWNRERGQQ